MLSNQQTTGRDSLSEGGTWVVPALNLQPLSWTHHHFIKPKECPAPTEGTSPLSRALPRTQAVSSLSSHWGGCFPGQELTWIVFSGNRTPGFTSPWLMTDVTRVHLVRAWLRVVHSLFKEQRCKQEEHSKYWKRAGLNVRSSLKFSLWELVMKSKHTHTVTGTCPPRSWLSSLLDSGLHCQRKAGHW